MPDPERKRLDASGTCAEKRNRRAIDDTAWRPDVSDQGHRPGRGEASVPGAVANLERGGQVLAAREAVNLARVFFDGMVTEFRDEPLIQAKGDNDIGAN